MQFRSYNHHKSSGIERFASNLSAIEYIIGFKKRNPREARIIKKAIIYFFVALLLLYLIITIYNVAMSNQAFGLVNMYTRGTLGYDILVNKGFFGHLWFYLIHPINNFSELGLNLNARAAFFAYEVAPQLFS